MRRLASVPPPAEDQRPIAEDVASVITSEVISAAQIEAARRWIAAMALRWVRAEGAGKDADDGA